MAISLVKTHTKRVQTLSVIIPVYNEAATINQVLRLVAKQRLHTVRIDQKQVVVVDDGSTDQTGNILRRWQRRYTVITHPQNRGLVAAMMTGLRQARGDLILVQHADLEYHPRDWIPLIKTLRATGVDMAMGSRYLKPKRYQRHFSIRYQLGGQGLTWLFNMLYGTYLTDIFTAHRVFTKDVLKMFRPRGKGFAFETELTAQTVMAGFKIVEIPISYTPRTFAQGKKLHWDAAFEVILAMVRTRLGGVG